MALYETRTSSGCSAVLVADLGRRASSTPCPTPLARPLFLIQFLGHCISTEHANSKAYILAIPIMLAPVCMMLQSSSMSHWPVPGILSAVALQRANMPTVVPNMPASSCVDGLHTAKALACPALSQATPATLGLRTSTAVYIQI